MKKFLKKLLLMLLAILISSPLAPIIMGIVDTLLMWPEELDDFWGSVYLLSFFSIPFYIILGIPVTLIIDAIISKTKVPFGYKSYLLQLLLYTLSAIAVYLFLLPHIIFTIPVFTYFHILLYLRMRSEAKLRNIEVT
ncbi:hypothetical protein KM915_21035 [Cytobacillus oceanisediminis]|nr:hypothetical protein [Cytobacillus oceanisediminis]